MKYKGEWFVLVPVNAALAEVIDYKFFQWKSFLPMSCMPNDDQLSSAVKINYELWVTPR